MAIVLDRVPRVMGGCALIWWTCSASRAWGTSPVFPIPETTLTDAGLIPDATSPAFGGVADRPRRGRGRAREVVVRQTCPARSRLSTSAPRNSSRPVAPSSGSLGEVAPRWTPRSQAARKGVSAGMSDGQLLRGEVLARWQESVGTGEFFKKVESGYRDCATGSPGA